MGRVKSIVNSPSTETFGKFISTNIGDPYNDKDKFKSRLRIGNSSPGRSGSVIVHSKPFKST